jgi:H+-translocating diphosphatase
MSADLFGSFAESTCAALVISSTSLISTVPGCEYYISNLMYPLILIAFGIFLCIFVSALSTHCMYVNTLDQVEKTLKMQLIVSTILLIGVIYICAYLSFPPEFKMVYNSTESPAYGVWAPYLCSLLGLISGMIIAGFT